VRPNAKLVSHFVASCTALALCGCPDSSKTSAPPAPDKTAVKTSKSVKKTATKTKTAKKTQPPPKAERRTRRSYVVKVSVTGKGVSQQATQIVTLVRHPHRAGERIAATCKDGGGLEMTLDATGQISTVSDSTLSLMIQGLIEARGLKPREAPRFVYLPGGGWLKQLHKITPIDSAEFGEDKRSCEGVRVSAQFTGERASGERIRGKLLSCEFYRDQETGELLAMIAKLEVQFFDHGVRRFKLSMLPQGKPSKDPERPGPWLQSLVRDDLARELGLPVIGSLLQASAIATAAKVSPKMWGSVAVAVAALGGLAAQAQAVAPLPSSGKVVRKREEPARTLTTLVPTANGPSVELVPTVFVDDADHVVLIEEAGKTRGLYVDAQTFAGATKGQSFDAGSGKGVDEHERSVATPEQAEALSKSGKPVLEQ
jgi:hypothetical protein